MLHEAEFEALKQQAREQMRLMPSKEGCVRALMAQSDDAVAVKAAVEAAFSERSRNARLFWQTQEKFDHILNRMLDGEELDAPDQVQLLRETALRRRQTYAEEIRKSLSWARSSFWGAGGLMVILVILAAFPTGTILAYLLLRTIIFFGGAIVGALAFGFNCYANEKKFREKLNNLDDLARRCGWWGPEGN